MDIKEIYRMKYKIGDIVRHIKTPQTERRVLEIKDNKYRLWGFYSFVGEEEILD